MRLHGCRGGVRASGPVRIHPAAARLYPGLRTVHGSLLRRRHHGLPASDAGRRRKGEGRPQGVNQAGGVVNNNNPIHNSRSGTTDRLTEVPYVRLTYRPCGCNQIQSLSIIDTTRPYGLCRQGIIEWFGGGKGLNCGGHLEIQNDN